MRTTASTSISTHRALAATVAQWRLTSSQRPMTDSLPTLRTKRLTLRPLADEDIEPLLAIVNDSEWWGESSDAEDLRCDGKAFTIEVDGEVAGWLGVSEENDPDYRYAGLDITFSPAYQNKGLGPEALRGVIGWLVERGHHRFTIDP